MSSPADAGPPAPTLVQPIGRMAGTGYAHINSFFEMHRVPPPVE